jgi:hypothetical protein
MTQCNYPLRLNADRRIAATRSASHAELGETDLSCYQKRSLPL